MREYFELFAIFFRIGAFTFGGGLAMLSVIQREIAENKKWATEKELLDCFAIAQCTPGVIAVNTATFIGYKRKKVLGAVVATLGVVLPSLVIITIIAAFLKNFLKYRIVARMFAGIRICIAALIINAVLTMGKAAVTDKICIAAAVSSFLLSAVLGTSPVLIVICAALLGIFVKRGERE